jgi:hypothetical protein
MACVPESISELCFRFTEGASLVLVVYDIKKEE